MRYIVPVLVLLFFVGSLASIKGAQIASLIEAGQTFAKAGPPPESVSTSLSREMRWENALHAVGSVVAAKGVAVSAELPGVVKRIHFESGDMAKQGEILVELDTRVERAQLRTLRAQQRLAEQAFARTRALTEGGGVPRAQFDTDSATLESANADLAALEAQIDRKQIRAPFAGKLGIRTVNLGQYLTPGTPVTTLESLQSVFIDFALPQQTLPQLQRDLPVRVSISGRTPLTFEGSIAAIDPAVDATTRSIQVRASAQNDEQKLSPGMFANVAVVLPGEQRVVAVAATAIVHAPYGDSLFVVSPAAGEQRTHAPAAPKQARQQFVRLGEQRGDFVAVLAGLEPGEEVVTSGAFKLRNGAPVVVNNSVKPTPELTPRPENR